jgi:hypothetical protein
MYGLLFKMTAAIEAQHAPKNRQASHDQGGDFMVLEIRCGVEGCENLTAYEVILYDIYFDSGEVFFERVCIRKTPSVLKTLQLLD